MRRSISPRNDTSTTPRTNYNITDNENTNNNQNNINENTPNNNTDSTENASINNSDSSYDIIGGAPTNDTHHTPPMMRTQNNTAQPNPIPENNTTNQNEILATLRDLQAGLQLYETRHNQTQAEIRQLQNQNQDLEDDLLLDSQRERELRNPPPPPPPKDEDDNSSISSVHPQPPPPPPLPPAQPQVQPQVHQQVHQHLHQPIPQPVQHPNPMAQPNNQALLSQLIAVHQQANMLQAQARLDEQQARIKLTRAKFPTLHCLIQDTIESWYSQVINIIKQPKYNNFYDPISHDLVLDGSFNNHLNTILFNELMLSLSKNIQDYIHSKLEIANDGVAVLQDITTSFQQTWGQIKRNNHVLAWMSLRIKRNKGYLDFFARCLKLRNISLSQAIPCSDNDLNHRFIMGLPPQFTSLQEKAHNLPEPWKSASIHKLLALAEEFMENKNSVRNLHRANRGENNGTTSNNNHNDTHQQSNTSSNTPYNTQQPRQQPQVDPITQQRQNTIYADIIARPFCDSTYSSQVPAAACIYHGNAHPGGTAACTDIRRILTKAAGQGIANIPIDNHLQHHPPTTQPTPCPPLPSPQTNHIAFQPNYQPYFHPYQQYQYNPNAFPTHPPAYHNTTQQYLTQPQPSSAHQPQSSPNTNPTNANPIQPPQAHNVTTTANDLNEITVD